MNLQSKKRSRVGSLRCAAAVLGVTTILTAARAESTWTGAAASSGIQLWESSSNWSGSVIPASGADVRFGGGFGSGSVINSAGSRTVGRLTIATHSTFYLRNFGGEGNSIILSSGDLDRLSVSQGTQVISSNLVMSTSGQWGIAGTGALHIAGAVNSAAGIGLEKSGPGTLVLSDATSSIGGKLWVTGGNLVVNGPADVTAADTSAFAGVLVGAGGSQLIVQAGGTLRGASIPSLSQGGAAVVTGNGSSWRHTGSAFSVGDIARGTLSVQNGGSFNTSGTMLLGFGSTGAQANGTLLVQFGGAAQVNYLTASGAAGSRGTVIVDGAAATLLVNDTADLGNTPGDAVGSMSITNGGAVTVGNNLRLFGANSAVSINAGSLVVGHLQSVGASGGVHLAADPTNGTALVFNEGGFGSVTFFAPLTGPGSICKTGSSTQVLLNPSYTGKTTLNDGTLSLPNGLSNAGAPIIIEPSGVLSAAGTVNRRIGNGSITSSGNIYATGTLTIGDATHADGFDFDGRLNADGYHVTLKDLNRAVLNYETEIGSGGKLSSTNGITANGSLTVNSTATITGPISVMLGVSAPSDPGNRLIFAGDVDGPASMVGNVEFQARYSPGVSAPADVNIDGLVQFGPSATFAVQLGGTTAGTQFDRLDVDGVILDGTLDVSTFNNFVPQQGQSFAVLRANLGDGSITQQFDQVTGRRMNATTWLATIYSTDEVRIAVALPGDATLDGAVSISDFSLLASSFNLGNRDWTGGDFDGNGAVNIGDFALLASNFNRNVTNNPLAGATVPEPEACVFIGVAAFATTRHRRW